MKPFSAAPISRGKRPRKCNLSRKTASFSENGRENEVVSRTRAASKSLGVRSVTEALGTVGATGVRASGFIADDRFLELGECGLERPERLTEEIHRPFLVLNLIPLVLSLSLQMLVLQHQKMAPRNGVRFIRFPHRKPIIQAVFCCVLHWLPALPPGQQPPVGRASSIAP
jgi:hypothetical protein